jgi:hypothetical protein
LPPAAGGLNRAVAGEAAAKVEIGRIARPRALDHARHIVPLQRLFEDLEHIAGEGRAADVPVGVEASRVHLAVVELVEQPSEGIGKQDVTLRLGLGWRRCVARIGLEPAHLGNVKIAGPQAVKHALLDRLEQGRHLCPLRPDGAKIARRIEVGEHFRGSNRLAQQRRGRGRTESLDPLRQSSLARFGSLRCRTVEGAEEEEPYGESECAHRRP